MKIAITGSSGMIGGAISGALNTAGHQLTHMRRRRDAARGADAGYWDPANGEVELEALEGRDVVMHFAAESIFGVWTKAKKERARRSRVHGTEVLSSAIARLERPPRTLISASAIGYYGDRPDAHALDESEPPGDSFSARMVVDWEAATAPAAAAGVRVVHLRMAPVLSPRGGMLKLLLPPFRLGLGGVAGSGDQMWSWVVLPDVVGAVQRVLDDEALVGPVNVAAPEAVSAREFSRTLGRALNRPVLLRVPAPIVSLAPGGMGDEMVLASLAVAPRKLEQSGYRFRLPRLEEALEAVL